MKHNFDLRVYYSDTDAGGIVYHARYLDFAEHARTELFRELAQQKTSLHALMKELRIGFVVKEISVDYINPSYLDDKLTVVTTIKNLKRFSLTFLQEIFRDNQQIATLVVKVASVNLDSGKLLPLQSWFVEAVEKFIN
ncbi:MAG: YbgC/FadM family acyl-CoA thioesterase [Sphaerochaetaceae bacterium]